MKTGNNILLFKKEPRGLEKLYSKPWKRFHQPDKWFRTNKLKNRKVDYDNNHDTD